MIASRIHRWAHSQPSKPALICNGYTLDYAAFSRAIAATCGYLASFGLAPGKTAILLAGNLDNSWIINLALRSIGLNTITLASPDQIEELQIKDAACIIALQPQNGQDLALASLPPGAKFIAIPLSIYKEIFSGDLPAPSASATPFGGYVLHTSGTTGLRKKLFFPGEFEDKRNAIRAAYFSTTRETVYHGLNYGLWTAAGFNHPPAVWHAGGTVVLDQRPEKFKAFLDHPVSWAFLDPAQLQACLKVIGTSQTAPGGFELTVAGGFLSLATAENTIRHLTKNLTALFGSTESCTPVMQSRFRSAEDLNWLTPAPGRSIEVVDEDGKQCAEGVEGRLRVLRTAVEPASYLDDDDANAEIFRDGYFYPGDIAVKRHDGRIRILGRAENVLNLRGQKVPVARLEQEIQQRLDVEEVCLFAGQTDSGEEELVIAIQSDRKLSEAALQPIADAYPTFGRIRFAVLKEFPRTETGMQKVKRHALRQMIFGESRNAK